MLVTLKSMTLAYIVLLVYPLTVFAAIIPRSSSGCVAINLQYESLMYLATGLQLGEKGTELSNIVLDTGSSDLIVSLSVYSSNSSSTSRFLGNYGETGFFSSQGSLMKQYSDLLTTDDWKLNNCTFGLVTLDINGYGGVLGIGYTTDEAFPEYPNLPAELKDEGLTSTKIFSLEGRLDSPKLYLGGIDTSIYSGPLVKTKVCMELGPTESRGFYNVLGTTVNSINLGGVKISDERLLYSFDTGSPALVTTQPIIDNLKTVVGNILDIDNQTYFDYEKVQGLDLTFDLTGFEAKIPLTDIVDSVTTFNGLQYAILRYTVIEIGGSEYIYEGALPNAFYNHYYTVFDMENNELLFAPYEDQGSSSNVVAIKDPSSYPVATTTAKDYDSTYTSFYLNDNEVTYCPCSSS